MKKALGLIAAFALVVPLVGTASSDIVCTETPPSQTTCSGTGASITITINCVCNPNPNPTPTPTPAPSSLLTGLVSSWPLSADGTDEVGSNDLTDHGTVTFVAKGGGAPVNLPDTVANFVSASSQYMTLSPTTPFVKNTPRTIAFWFNTTSAGTARMVSIGTISAGRVLDVYLSGGVLNLYSDGAGSMGSTGTVNDGSWHSLIYTFDGADAHRLYIDGAAAVISGTGADPVGSYASFAFAGFSDGTSLLDTKISTAATWSRVITSDERACYHNSGAATVYPFTGVCN